MKHETKNNQTLKTLIKAARAGGEVLLTYFGKELKQSQKSAHPGDYQTDADLASEKIILKILQKELPDYNIFSEEQGFVGRSSKYTITVDPLCGTHQFVLGISDFGVILSLRRNNQTQCGVLYEPIIKRLSFCQKGKGSYQQIGNGSKYKMSVNQVNTIESSTIYLIVAFNTPHAKIRRLHNALFDAKVKRILRPWTAVTFNRLAAGRIEGIVCADVGLHDFLAGKLICLEAGAQITHFGEKIDTNPNFVLSNPQIHKKLVNLASSIMTKNFTV